MLLKRFEAATVPEALAAVRRELGENAVLLHTRTVAPSGMGRFFTRPRVEVLAALDGAPVRTGPVRTFEPRDVGPAARQARHEARPEWKFEPRGSGRAAGEDSHEARPEWTFEPRGSGRAAGVAVRNEARQRRGEAQREALPDPAEPGDGRRVPAPLRLLYQRLCAQDVADATAQAVLRGLQRRGGKPTATAAKRLVADRLAVAPSHWDRADRRPRRIAFVGPTGAGKTTTMAKVAAKAQLTHGRKIGLVTMDTYRIGAIPQLKVYADLLQAPLEVVTRAQEMDRALGALSGQELVFIDTIGRSPLSSSVDDLVPFVEAAQADEIHLVLPATTRSVDLLKAAKAFAKLRPNRLCFTKLDETAHYGGILTVSHVSGLPLTWLGVGQEVPDDLEEAQAERIATAIVAGAVA